MVIPFKVYCIQSTDEADTAIAAGATAIGLVGPMPNGPGTLDDGVITKIAAHVEHHYGGQVWVTLLSSRTAAEDIYDHTTQTGVRTVQLVDHKAIDAPFAVAPARAISSNFASCSRRKRGVN